MAFVSSGWTLSVTLLDNSGNDTTITYELRGTDHAGASANVTSILAALGAVTGGEIASYRLYQTFQEDSLSLPAVGFQAEVSASMTAFIADEGSKKASYRIPMPVPNVFVSTIGAGANQVNTSQADVIAYHGLFEPVGVAFISDGEIAGGLLNGVRVTRAKRGG